MEPRGKPSSAIPLIEPSSSAGGGTASTFQTLGNIIVSVVGTGVLGLPFAFRVAGWLAGSLGVLIAGVSTYYCMLLLVECKGKIESDEESQDTKSFGDLGFKSMGLTGRYMTESLIFLSQCGGAVAYLVFIGQNLSSIFKGHFLSYEFYIFLLVPIQIMLSWIDSLSTLAPFSLFAAICNLLAMSFVVKEDIEQAVRGQFSFSDREAITSIGGLPFAGGMAVFCFEGFGMTLALEASMEERGAFPKLLAKTFAGITIVYGLFGFSGYMAYGDQTKDIITLNLPNNWSAIAVQIGLCLGLIFTFPIMVHPMHEIVEGKLGRSMWFQEFQYTDDSMRKLGKFAKYISRAIIIIGLAVLASFVPGFSMFASLVGSTACAIISFVLPASFHLRLMGSSLNFRQRALDYFILTCGLLFAAYGTYDTMVGV